LLLLASNLKARKPMLSVICLSNSTEAFTRSIYNKYMYANFFRQKHWEFLSV